MVEGWPTAIVVGLAEQLTNGGSGCFTANVALQLTTLFFFSFSSMAVAVTVYWPGARSAVSTDLIFKAKGVPSFGRVNAIFPVPKPNTLPPVLLNSNLTVCLGLKFSVTIAAVTGSPDQISVGETEQLAVGGGEAEIP